MSRIKPSIRLTPEKMAVPRRRINEIIRGRRSVTPDTAIRLSKVFNMTPEYWLNLQMKLDLWLTIHDEKKKKEYEKLGAA